MEECSYYRISLATCFDKPKLEKVHQKEVERKLLIKAGGPITKKVERILKRWQLYHF